MHLERYMLETEPLSIPVFLSYAQQTVRIKNQLDFPMSLPDQQIFYMMSRPHYGKTQVSKKFNSL